MKKSQLPNSGNIKVVCRVRPPNKSELSQFDNGMQKQCVEFAEDDCTIRLLLSETDKPQFTFDRVFGEGTNQQQIYEYSAKPVVQSVLEGYNGTVFAYGQTSSGKTHTMQGPSIKDLEQKGIVPRMVTTLFQHVNTSPKHLEFRIKISIVEIYMEKIKDLLEPAKNNLTIREDRTRGVYIQDVTEKYVANEAEVFQIIEQGNSNRSVAFTNMNEGSSRSHMLFILNVHQNNLEDLSAKSSKLFLVDLAGSEKISKTGAEGKTLDEAKRINQSLSQLGNVINALTDGKSSHIPYRDSKLTRVLQESLGGNSTTTLIITCSPSSFNDQETLSTLRFGMRAKSIKNKPKINREFTTQELSLIISNQEKIIEDQKRQIKILEKQITSPREQSDSAINFTINNESNINLTSALLDLSAVEEIKVQLHTFQSFILSTLSFQSDDKVIELETQLEAERAKCEGYAFQLREAKRELSRIEGDMDDICKDSDIMSSRLTELALCLNDLEVEMLSNKLSLERSGEAKQKVMQHISQLKKMQKTVVLAKEGKASKNLFERNNRTLEMIGKEDSQKINRDLLLVCQTKLSEEEFKLFLNQVIVMQKEGKESDEVVILKEELVHEQQVRINLEEENKQIQQKLEQAQEIIQKHAANQIEISIQKEEELSAEQKVEEEQKKVEVEEEITQKNSQQIDFYQTQLIEIKESMVQKDAEFDKERDVWEKQLQRERNLFKQSKEKIIEELQQKVSQGIALEQELQKLREMDRKKEQEYVAKEDKLLFQINFFKERLDQKSQIYENAILKVLTEQGSNKNNAQNNTNQNYSINAPLTTNNEFNQQQINNFNGNSNNNNNNMNMNQSTPNNYYNNNQFVQQNPNEINQHMNNNRRSRNASFQNYQIQVLPQPQSWEGENYNETHQQQYNQQQNGNMNNYLDHNKSTDFILHDLENVLQESESNSEHDTKKGEGMPSNLDSDDQSSQDFNHQKEAYTKDNYLNPQFHYQEMPNNSSFNNQGNFHNSRYQTTQSFSNSRSQEIRHSSLNKKNSLNRNNLNTRGSNYYPDDNNNFQEILKTQPNQSNRQIRSFTPSRQQLRLDLSQLQNNQRKENYSTDRLNQSMGEQEFRNRTRHGSIARQSKSKSNSNSLNTSIVGNRRNSFSYENNVVGQFQTSNYQISNLNDNQFIQEVDDDNVSEAYNAIMPVKRFQMNQAQSRNMNTQGLSLNSNIPPIQEQPSLISSCTNKRFITNNNSINNNLNTCSEDTDYYNILKTTEVETNRSGQQSNESMQKQPHFKSIAPFKLGLLSPNQQKQREDTNPPKNSNPILDYMKKQQTTPTNFMNKRTPITAEQQKQLLGLNILRGNPTLSSFVSQYSLKLLNNPQGTK